MAKFAVLTSGNGSNFEAIAKAVRSSSHVLSALVCDRKGAYAFERAQRLGIESFHVTWFGRDRLESENELSGILSSLGVNLVVLAGFMRILSPGFVSRWSGKIVNIHPSLLPKYPGTESIRRSFEAGDEDLGITVHWVDEGTDTGKIITQARIRRTSADTLENVESKIHSLEHSVYPKEILAILNDIDSRGGASPCGSESRR